MGGFFILFNILCIIAMAVLVISLIVRNSRNDLPGHRNPPPPPTKKSNEV